MVHQTPEGTQPTNTPMTESEVVAILREKAGVYADHPDYPWLLAEDEPNKVGNLMAYELNSTADLIEWLAARR